VEALGGTQFVGDVNVVPVNNSLTNGDPSARAGSTAVPTRTRPANVDPTASQTRRCPRMAIPSKPRCAIAHIDSARHQDRGE
jgi:hypothetical protein